MNFQDDALIFLLVGLFGLLILASVAGIIIEKYKGSTPVIVNLNARIRAWWGMCLLSVAAMCFGPSGSIWLC
ncbi:hypothetical protein F9C28_20120 [Shimwellia pseudoproteus]|uniref:hypothetical protein n=1 Tax=Shimwellia pseudoproteus TaxID=570012 RepID=UPI0018ED6A6B|nr:hypothetical protein [Shimwellia pseudoproteus]MBJ3817107.1 hypothetical protein [Shimwellia pseudoproteus]